MCVCVVRSSRTRALLSFGLDILLTHIRARGMCHCVICTPFAAYYTRIEQPESAKGGCACAMSLETRCRCVVAKPAPNEPSVNVVQAYYRYTRVFMLFRVRTYTPYMCMAYKHVLNM